jgi:hypothetical protein
MNEVANTPVPVLNLPRQDHLLIPYAWSVQTAFTGNIYFPNPDPPMLVFTKDLTDYEDAQALAVKRGQGAATLRNGKRRRVIADLNHLCDYVSSVIETQPPDLGAAMILSAGMSLKQVTKRVKQLFTARNGGGSGVVLLDAKAVAAVAMYYWQYSLDQKNWFSVPEAMKASAVISGLTPLTTYYFRFRATTRKGPGELSQVVSLLVL